MVKLGQLRNSARPITITLVVDGEKVALNVNYRPSEFTGDFEEELEKFQLSDKISDPLKEMCVKLIERWDITEDEPPVVAACLTCQASTQGTCPIPDVFPGRAILVGAGVETLEQVRELLAKDEVPGATDGMTAIEGIHPALWMQIDEAQRMNRNQGMRWICPGCGADFMPDCETLAITEKNLNRIEIPHLLMICREILKDMRPKMMTENGM